MIQKKKILRLSKKVIDIYVNIFRFFNVVVLSYDCHIKTQCLRMSAVVTTSTQSPIVSYRVILTHNLCKNCGAKTVLTFSFFENHSH